MTIKELIELLQKEDPDALVVKYEDGHATKVEGVDQIKVDDKPAVLIE